ncbi:hypothetical protein ACEQ8H_001984 [Pleosporales sp. CAS-2024a]
MSNVKQCTREDFLRDYSFPTEPARDFGRDGTPAEFASGHPWSWDDLTHSEAIVFGSTGSEQNKRPYRSVFTALSSDQRLLAISSSRESIAIYHVATKELRATLEGSGRIVFRPVQEPVQTNGYALISSISDIESRGHVPQHRLIIWDLDQHGRLIDQEEPIDAASFASQAIEAILPRLTSDHEWTADFAHSSGLHDSFEKGLSHVAEDHRRRHYTILENASLGRCGSSSFSDDGRFFLYHSGNESTQKGMREPEELPRVVVYDMDASKEIYRLAGHTDAIMWSAVSPDCQHVASVAWDGTMRMYSANTGKLSWATEDSGGQSWAGAFTPDSKHIIWSSKGGRVIQVHAVSDGRKICTFKEELHDWCRCFVWDPTGEKVAFAARKHAYVWCPFEGPDGTIDQHYVLDEKERWSMISISSVKWMKNGELLALEFSEGTKLVYNTSTNTKELFRPKGVWVAGVNNGIYGILSGPDQPEFYLTVDGDRNVRYHRTSVPSSPSWWEKELEKQNTSSASRKMYPETGKYVKVTKVLRKAAPKDAEDDDRASWAEKGAAVWTAE